MSPEEKEQLVAKGRGRVKDQIAACEDVEAVVELIISYYKQGFEDGVKAGTMRVLETFKTDIDKLLADIAKVSASAASNAG